MQPTTKEWIIQAIAQLPEPETEQLKDYLEFLAWKSRQKPKPNTGKNTIAQQITAVMETPPHLTHEDGQALRQSIEEGKIPVKFESPLESEEPKKS